MARRTVLTSRQRSALFSLPQREVDLLRHYTLSDEDLQHIGARRRPRNKLGFALQLCVLRYPGRLLTPGEFVPPVVVDFIGRQLDLNGDELADYVVRSETRHEHLADLRRLYGFRAFSGRAARELGDRLREEAQRARANEHLVRGFVDACRRTRTILPTTTTIERLCADEESVDTSDEMAGFAGRADRACPEVAFLLLLLLRPLVRLFCHVVNHFLKRFICCQLASRLEVEPNGILYSCGDYRSWKGA